MYAPPRYITALDVLGGRTRANNMACRQIMNNFSTDGNGSPGKTYHLRMALPVPALAIRLVMQNQTTSALTGLTAIASSVASITEALNNAGAWTAATFGGASSGTLPAGTALAPAYLKTDWIPVVPLARSDAGPGAIYFGRVFVPIANATVPVIGNGGAVSPSTTWTALTGQEYSNAVNIGDFVSSPGTFSVAGEGSPIICGIEYMTAAGISIANFGDSIQQGYLASAPGNNALNIAALAKSTVALPISVQNYAQGGSNSSTYIALAETYIPLQKPYAAAYGAFSPNDTTPTAATILNQKIRVGRFLKVCYDNNVIPILVTSTPNTNAGNTTSTYSAAQDDLVKGLDDYVRALCTAGKALLLDNSLIMSNTQSTGVARLWKAGYNASGDGLHPGDTGYQASAADMTVGAGAVIAYLAA